MTRRDLAELAFRNLREALLRNSLTTLGVAVGVASLVAMLSLGVGLQALASQRLTRSGLFDAIFVTSQRDARGPGRGPRSDGGGPMRRPLEVPAQPAKLRPLDQDAREEFKKIPRVGEVYPQIRFFTEVRYDGKTLNTSAMSLPDSSRRSDAFEAITGKYFSSATAAEAILQSEFARELALQPGTLLGKDLTLHFAASDPAAPLHALPEENSAGLLERAAAAPQQKPSSPRAAAVDDEIAAALQTTAASPSLSIVPRDKTLRIVGIIDSDPSAGIGGFGGARIYLPLATAELLHVAQPNDLQTLLSQKSSKPSYTALTVRVENPKYVPAVEAAIKQLGFSTFSLLDATRGLRLVFTVFDLFLGLFGSLALTVASLGIINTLVMAILERRREIGVLKALGATDGDVRKLFFAEAGAMGFVGGIFGVALGWLIGQALTWGTTIYLRRQDLPGVKISYVPWWLALGAVLFAIAVSLIAGLYPAARAAKLNPVDALRYE